MIVSDNNQGAVAEFSRGECFVDVDDGAIINLLPLPCSMNRFLVGKTETLESAKGVVFPIFA